MALQSEWPKRQNGMSKDRANSSTKKEEYNRTPKCHFKREIENQMVQDWDNEYVQAKEWGFTRAFFPDVKSGKY